MDVKGTKLLIRREPKLDESFIGYLLRLAEINGYQTLSWILQLAGIKRYVQTKFSFAFDDSLDLTPLVRLSGVDYTVLSSLQYLSVNNPRRKMGEYSVFGSSVSQYMIRLRYPKICPTCLIEANYARKIWELAPVTACPLHNCMLLDECPRCMKRISWGRSSVSICRCKFDWRECETSTIKAEELELVRNIHMLCNLLPSVNERDRYIGTNPLEVLDLKHFLSALFFVASQYAGIIDTKGKHLAPSMRNAELHLLLCKAWKVFGNWPCSYFDFLGWRRMQVTDSPAMRGLRRDFAEYKSALYKQLAVPELGFMRTAFEKYLVQHWQGGYASHVKRLNGAASHCGKYASRREAKSLLKVGVQSIDKLISIGTLTAIVQRQANTRLILIERSGLLEFKHELDQSLYLKQVQGLLALSHRRVLELVACGLLNPLRGPIVDGCSDWKFSEKEVKNLLYRIKRKLRPGEPVRNDALISFLMSLRKLRVARIFIGQFIKDILAGEIRPLGASSKSGLNAFQFSKKQIAEYCNSRLQAKREEVFCLQQRV